MSDWGYGGNVISTQYSTTAEISNYLSETSLDQDFLANVSQRICYRPRCHLAPLESFQIICRQKIIQHGDICFVSKKLEVKGRDARIDSLHILWSFSVCVIIIQFMFLVGFWLVGFCEFGGTCVSRLWGESRGHKYFRLWQQPFHLWIIDFEC